jgi:hypothetical protein
MAKRAQRELADEYTVVDVDSHYLDHIDEIFQYMDEDDPWRERFEKGYESHMSESYGDMFPQITSNAADHGTKKKRYRSTEDVLSIMDRMGIDETIIIGEQMLQFGAFKADDERPIKYTEAYMEYMLDNVADVSEGVYLVVPVVHTDPDAAVEIIDRYKDEESVVGTCIVAKGGQPPFGHHKYDPIYDICESNDLPIIVHAGGSSLDDYYNRGMQTHLETHALGFLINNMTQLTSMVVQGVPEKFPDLDLIFQEAGLFYIPTIMYRLDMEYIKSPDEAPLLNKRPSEYMKEFYYGTQPIEETPDPRYIEWVMEMIGGPERFMWCSDWPHRDHDETNVITRMSWLSEDEKQQILGGNALEVYDI